MRAEEGMIEWNQLEPMLTEIEEAATNIGTCTDNEKIYESLKKLVPQFSSQSNGFDAN